MRSETPTYWTYEQAYAEDHRRTVARLSRFPHVFHHIDFGAEGDAYDVAAAEADPTPRERVGGWVATDGEGIQASRKAVPLYEANAISSAVDEDVWHKRRHTVMLDIDYPTRLTELAGGGTVVIIDKPGTDREKFRDLVLLMASLGFVHTSHGHHDDVGVAFNVRTGYPVIWVPTSTEGHGHLYIDVLLTWDDYQQLLEAFGNVGLLEEGYVGASIRRRATHLRLPWVRKRCTATKPGVIPGLDPSLDVQQCCVLDMHGDDVEHQWERKLEEWEPF